MNQPDFAVQNVPDSMYPLLNQMSENGFLVASWPNDEHGNPVLKWDIFQHKFGSRWEKIATVTMPA